MDDDRRRGHWPAALSDPARPRRIAPSLADLLLIDEAVGRAEARRRNLRVTRTLGVLRAAAELGLVDVPGLIVRIEAASFYADDALLTAVFGR